MGIRSELLAKQIGLAMNRARETEDTDLGVIASDHAVRGVANSGANIDARHKRRWKTLTELLDFRIKLEREVPLAAEDEATWYTDLQGSIFRIIDGHTGRILQGLEQDAARFGGGGHLPTAWHDQVSGKLKMLCDQYLREAEIIRDERELEAKMPKSPPGQTRHITLNITQSSIANLNLGEQVGQIQNIVGGLQDKGWREIADAIKRLTEEIVAAPGEALTDAQKREAVELVAAISEEVTKRPEQRRGAALRAVGAGLRALVKHVDKLAAAYELVKAAARTQGIDLP